ncbi:hypothetical protein C2L98_06085 [Enterococcus gallinarum]|nr:hypothetical protein C2L98_06085 [Enterococcus gallinarum]TFV18727.1 hypothetical protein E4T76_05325 [Enterococcus gallinarum]
MLFNFWGILTYFRRCCFCSLCVGVFRAWNKRKKLLFHALKKNDLLPKCFIYTELPCTDQIE